jgi:hypothetical protein
MYIYMCVCVCVCVCVYKHIHIIYNIRLPGRHGDRRHPTHPESRLPGLLGLFRSLTGLFIGLF